MPYPYGGITEQRRAAISRREDADALREKRRWRGAMYMLGYAIECSLKARLMERFGCQHLQELERQLGRRLKRKLNLRTHSLDVLLEYAQSEHRLTGSLQHAYNRCRTWTVQWRYDPFVGNERECLEFFEDGDRFLKFVAHTV